MKTTTLFLTLATASAFAQGPLIPLAAPAPSMKTLDQIEARTAIQKSPAVPLAGPHYIISKPGSYYLTGNVEVVSGNGINITASNVCLDLNGFSLINTTASPAAGAAIDLASGLSNVQIKNGNITGGTVRTSSGPQPWQATFVLKGWSFGVLDVDISPAQGVLISQLTVEKCGDSGIYLSGVSAIEHVTATANGNNGIYTIQSSITQATSTNNGNAGILANRGSVSNSITNNNVYTGIDASYSSLTTVTASQNGSTGVYSSYGTITNASGNNNGGDGINMYQGSLTQSTAVSNGNNGIVAYGGIVTDSSASYNSGMGISATGGSVSQSRATSNFTVGIYVGAGVAAHCVASGNSTNPSSSDKEIEVAPTGQRDACVPASE
jgi:hypothetical protein